MELTSVKTIKELFLRHGFDFSKQLGQNFLINPSVCPKISPVSQNGENGLCAFEIGAGIGVLTKELAKNCKKVVTVEIDRGLEGILNETLADYKNAEIIYGDVMKLDLKQIFDEKFSGEDVVCCANLPYYITSPVIMRLLEERLPLKSITVMVQKEAADRLCALPGTRECGAVSVAVRYYCQPKKLFSVSRGSFMPAPNVDSAVIRLDMTGEKRRAENEDLFFKIVKCVFSERRKQIINPLSALFGVNKEVLRQKLEKIGIDPSARAERLSMDDFFNLSDCLNK